MCKLSFIVFHELSDSTLYSFWTWFLGTYIWFTTKCFAEIVPSCWPNCCNVCIGLGLQPFSGFDFPRLGVKHIQRSKHCLAPCRGKYNHQPILSVICRS